MNFEDESYVRLYTRKTITSKRLGWEGRVVLWHLMCECDRAGIIEVGDGDLVEALTVLLVDIPEEVISAAAPRLESQGVTRRHGSKLLIVRFIEAQEAKRSDAARAREYRDRRRAGLATPRDDGDTPRDVQSRTVTPRHDSSLSAVLPLPPLPATPVAREASPPPADDAGSEPVWEERETSCPLDLVEKLVAKGVHVEMAEKLRVEVDSVLWELRDFVSYWTIGEGMGKRRRHWAAKARERVRKRASEGSLKAPGAAAHADRKAAEPVAAPYHAPAKRRRENGPIASPQEAKAAIAAALAGMAK